MRSVQARCGTAVRTTLPLADLRAMLEEQREFRLEQLRELRDPAHSGPLASTQPEIVRSLVAGAEEALRDIQAALGRMAGGRYGWCVTCGQPVEAVRLEILPQTADCMSCQRR